MFVSRISSMGRLVARTCFNRSACLTTDDAIIQSRAYVRETDQAAVQRIWREVGWIDKDNQTHLDDFLADAIC